MGTNITSLNESRLPNRHPVQIDSFLIFSSFEALSLLVSTRLSTLTYCLDEAVGGVHNLLKPWCVTVGAERSEQIEHVCAASGSILHRNLEASLCHAPCAFK